MNAANDAITQISAAALPYWLDPPATRIPHFQLRRLFRIHDRLVEICRVRIEEYEQYHRRRRRKWAFWFFYFMGDFMSSAGTQIRETRLIRALDDCKMWLDGLGAAIILLVKPHAAAVLLSSVG